MLVSAYPKAKGATMHDQHVPPGFDAETYYRLNPDVRAARADAAEHYKKFGRAEGRRWSVEKPHYERSYTALVNGLLARHERDEAMSLAVGGDFEVMGRLQVDLLEKHAGLVDGSSLLDLGCGSGRTLSQIAKRFPRCDCVGIDVVQQLLDYAKAICPPSYRLIRHTGLSIPLPDSSIDLILVFSVFTHLTHDESYAYLEDAVRVLRRGGRIALSFLEFARPDTWQIFIDTVATRKAGIGGHMNTYIERPVIELWSKALQLDVQGFFGGMGQTLCVMKKPA
jgi:SAM-dependent methyltransferase